MRRLRLDRVQASPRRHRRNHRHPHGDLRDGVAIGGLADPFSEVFYPGNPIVDGFGITFNVGGRDYNFYSGGDFFDQEYSYVSGEFGNDGEGRLIAAGSATLTAVPEPAAWALMIVGFGLTGVTLRRRSAVPA